MVPITNQGLDRQNPETKTHSNARRKAEFGVSYLKREFEIEQARAQSQVAYYETDHGFDGFHFDSQRRNLYLLSFECADSHEHLKQALKRIVGIGIDLVFGAHHQQRPQDQLLIQIRSCLAENEALIERICIHFVFTGDPRHAERSQALDRLREDLETKKHVIDKYFGRSTTMVIEFRSSRTKTAGAISQLRNNHSYTIQLVETISRGGPAGENMIIGFLPLADLHAIYQAMGARFLERNIRSALPETEIVNCSIRQTLKQILLDATQDPSTFAFNHNGVTLCAEAIERNGKHFTVTEPRLLNGAQTVIIFGRFLAENDLVRRRPECLEILRQVHVLSRVITDAHRAFVTTVTINNNRQNPVRAWNLHANDMIQLELQDKFRNDLGIYYERQQNTFQILTNDEFEQDEITQYKPIDLLRLARTFLASDGQLDILGHFHKVFENDETYDYVFDGRRLDVDSRRILLCYKVQFRLGRLIRELVATCGEKYDFVPRARYLLWALLCQALLNDPDLDALAQDFGGLLGVESGYYGWLSNAAMTKCRVLLADLARDENCSSKTVDNKFDFIRTTASYTRAMELAQKRWGWSAKRLG